MMKSLYEELGGTYTLADDGMYYPNITLVENEHCLIGRWGRMHRAWLEAERPGLYELLILNGTLFRHLADADERVEKMSEQLTAQLIKHEGITEALKANDPLEWVRRMNNIRNRVEEIIMAEIVQTL